MPQQCSMILTTVQTSLVSPTVGDRSTTRKAVRRAIDTEGGNDKATETKRSSKQGFEGLLSFLEFVFVSIYNCASIGLHAGLAIAFLAIVAVAILGSFHDNYFITILKRAHRDDFDLKSENTYYERRCDMTDVTTSDSHHIHFGGVDDTASEIFIDVEKIWNEEIGMDSSNLNLNSNSNQTEDFYYDDRGFRTHYQHRKPRRKRRRLGLKFNIWESPELKPIPKNVAEKAGQLAVDTMMKHGSVMIPQILSDATIIELRDFISRKNEKILGTSDEYPMTASHHRISYGIESTEHPAVVRALKEIHNHGVFANLIKTLVGDENPALSEITAITAWGGAKDQSWHADVKPDGNGVKFGRTYSHSYSLFLTLQDTLEDMGATELCPGTHMCGTDGLWEICDNNGISVSNIRKARPRNQYSSDDYGEEKYQRDLQMEGRWRAGDGVLLNQQGWHRGPGHKDEDLDDRIVFIVSFLKRPDSNDPRQLARGTYFHQKWLNWGSTWEDMVDTMANLQRPWNILRCLHLYKPSDRSWGYDLFTATALRVANGQMGGEPEDLDGIIDNVMIPLSYPEWLQGDIDHDDEYAWTVYLSGTIIKTLDFLYEVNVYGLIGLVVFLAIASIIGYMYNMLLAKISTNSNVKRSVAGPVIQSGVKRLLLTHGSILALGVYFWHVTICSSQWALDIDSGKTLMRPFPTDPTFLDEDPGVLGVNTTLPRRSDVLIGTRLNTKAIGAYHNWFDYHPGNRVFNQFVDAYGGVGGFYHSLLPKGTGNRTLSELPSRLSDNLVNSAFDLVTKHHGGGRFVMQDYRSGDWMVLNEAQSFDHVKKSLLIGSKHANTLGVIQEEIKLLLDKQRFGVPRKALSMSWNSQLFLLDLSNEVFSTNVERDASKSRTSNTLSPLAPSFSDSMILPRSGYRLPEWEPIGPTVSSANDSDGDRVFLIGEGSSAFRPGMEVWLVAPDEDQNIDVYRGTVVGISTKIRFRDRRCRFRIAIEEDGVAALDKVEIDNVPRQLLRPRSSTTSGSRVSAEFDESGKYFDGTILLVTADGNIDVKFDDGDIAEDLSIDQYVTMDSAMERLYSDLTILESRN